jgi:hypothetical protein
MSSRTDFFQETVSATTEILGGSPGAWGTKMIAGVVLALMQSVEAATIAIAVFLVLCILDAVLGVMRQLKVNREPNSVNVPIKVWRLVSGPASKWLVGGIVLLASSFFDHVMFGADAWMGGPVLKFCTGIVLGAITIEVAAKADYLQKWGISDKLRARFPEFFAPETND